MSDQNELSVIETLNRISAADLGLDQSIDVSRLIRQLTKRQALILQQMQEVIVDLDQVAARLRQPMEGILQETLAAREHIAHDFANGALAIGEARKALALLTEQHEYARYKLF